MVNFFAMLYKWFGLVPLYSRGLDDFLKGWDASCTGYYALKWYLYVGYGMTILTVLIFALQYDLISSDRFQKKEHGELAAFVVFICNFLIAFTIPFVAHEMRRYCVSLDISVADCAIFGLSNAIWGLVLFGVLTGIQRLTTRSKNP
jgi:hypothetical protein